jgi:hypothetical protein
MSLLSHAAETSLGKDLLKRFRENEFDIAGLADLPDDRRRLDAVLRRIGRYVVVDGFMDDEKLAEVLFCLIRVAQEDYHEGNFWGRLSERLGRDLNPKEQERLGDWFQRGLKRLEYPVPVDHGGLKWLTPILVHAGTPRCSIPLLVKLVYQHRDAGEDLDAVEIQRLAEADGVVLHRNVRRLLTSRMQGAVQVWSAVARVVAAWPIEDRMAEELGRLPLALDPDAIRQALEGLDRNAVAESRAPAPRLIYDAVTGDVRLWLPGNDADRWMFDVQGLVLTLWEPSAQGRSAEVVRPLPVAFIASPPAGRPTNFDCQPKNWPGLWFRASNGNLKPGDDVDRDGLEPGRWLTVFEGRPDGDVGIERPLNWAFVQEGQDWTAWEVDVPPRAVGREQLVWGVGDSEFSVPLARRPSPRVVVRDEARSTARVEGLDAVPVFDAAPTVTASRDRAVAARLARRLGGRWLWVQDLELPAGRPVRTPAELPGVYQLREARNVGRVLLDFVVLPGIRELGAGVDADFERTTWVLGVASSIGSFRPAGEGRQLPEVRSTSPTNWEVHATTVEPYVSVAWVWDDPQSPPLRFDKPVEGLRWRLKGLSPETSQWTRATLMVDPKQVLNSPEQVRIEVQAPREGSLLINGVPAVKLVDGPTGRTLIRELTAYIQAEQVRLTYRGHDHAAVLLARRPILERFLVEADGQTVVVNWSPEQPEGTVLMAWDPLTPQDQVACFPLTSEQLREPGEWIGDWGQLPDASFVALALARKSATGLGRKAIYLMAVDAADAGRPWAGLVPRPPASSDDLPWAKFAHDLLLGLRSDRDDSHVDVGRHLRQLDQAGHLDIGSALQFLRRLEAMEVGARTEPARLASARAIREYLKTGDTPRRLLERPVRGPSADYGRIFIDLLRIGVHPGGYAESTTESHASLSPYPAGYFADLSLISTASDVPHDRCRAAARRVAATHDRLDLPPLSLALPWRWGQMRQETCHRYHLFERPPDADRVPPADQLLCELGLEDWALDVVEVRSDHRPKPGKPSTYRRRAFSLYWDARSGKGWAIEEVLNGGRRFRTCCSTGGRPLMVPPCDPLVLSARIDLRRRLIRWGTGLPEVEAGRGCLGDVLSVDGDLKTYPRLGVLHAHILEPPRLVQVSLLGGQFARVEHPPIPEPSLIAWRLAWWDRLAFTEPPLGGPSAPPVAARALKDPPATDAYRGPTLPSRPRAPHRTSPAPVQFLEPLATALEVWPELMSRCLALAEFLRWTLCEQGLGLAVKFARATSDPEMSGPARRPERS